MTKLTTRHGIFCLPDGTPLIRVYPEGDCDHISEVESDQGRKNLMIALYDARETGQIGDVDHVLLPDGRRFYF